MKKTLLIGIAALFLATGAAHAKWKPKPPSTFLPAEMQGNWCRDNDRNRWDTFHRKGCSNKDLWVIWSNGWTSRGGRDTCTFNEIDKLDRYIYYVRGICKSNTPSNMTSNIPNEGLQAWHPTSTSIYTEMREVRLVDDALVMWDLPDV
jgi:hypothetical protein